MHRRNKDIKQQRDDTHTHESTASNRDMMYTNSLDKSKETLFLRSVDLDCSSDAGYDASHSVVSSS